MFTVYPAIDLKDGRCVRLRQGVATEATVYSDDPAAMACHWEAEGARWLHVVDLDGAFEGRPRHTEVIRRIAAAVSIPVQVGGGLRTDEDLERMLEAGVARVIVGTRVIAEPEGLRRMVAAFGDRVAVGIDARGGRVQVRGWVETTGTEATDLAARVAAAGISTLIYTDTATDGMLGGPNLEAVRKVCAAAACGVIASGGVSSAEDVAALRGLGCCNLCGAIVGKALYEGRVSLRDLVRGEKGSGQA